MRDTDDKPLWGQVEKVGKGTKAAYDPVKKNITFAFNRGPEASSELLRAAREKLMRELRDLGYPSRMSYNGEVLVENLAEGEVVVEKKSGKVLIHLNKRLTSEEKAKSASGQNP